MKDLNRVLLVLLSDATIGPVSSGRQYKCQSTFSRTERATPGATLPLRVPIDSPSQVPSGEFCRVSRLSVLVGWEGSGVFEAFHQAPPPGVTVLVSRLSHLVGFGRCLTLSSCVTRVRGTFSLGWSAELCYTGPRYLFSRMVGRIVLHTD